MRTIFIKYDPQKIETNITVDWKPLKKSSLLNIAQGIRLADWIDKLPQILRDEYNSKKFVINFNGTAQDAELVKNIIKKANNNGMNLNFEYTAVFKPTEEKNVQKTVNRETGIKEDKKKDTIENNDKVHDIFIRHEPYIKGVNKDIVNIVTVDWRAIDISSRLYLDLNMDFYLWVKRLPQVLKEEYKSNNFKISFNGTVKDFQYLETIVDAANKNGMKISAKHINVIEEKNQTTKTENNSVKNKYQKDVQKNVNQTANQNIKGDKSMRQVYIKYNPFIVTTEIKVDNQPVKKSSGLYITPESNKRLQTWIDELPDILKDEFNTSKFDIKFKGTKLDFQDVKYALDKANNNGFKIRYSFEQTKNEIADKEQQIKKLFDETQNGLCAEFKEADFRAEFNKLYNTEFPIDIIATMSSGKSTLINALLRKKLMPSKNAACTATITRIKDSDKKIYSAKVYDKNGRQIESQANLSLDCMNRLNTDERVSTIEVEGDIPFVSANDMSLVLVDTPGANNARDENHMKTTYKEIEDSANLILYIIDGTKEFTNDDDILLRKIADSMKAKGKQSKERFLFVLNKLDNFSKDDDSIRDTITRGKKYLRELGIENPIILPASAGTALDIYMNLVNKNIDTTNDFEDVRDEYEDDDDIYECLNAVRKMNRREFLHLEKYAELPASVQEEVNRKLEEAKEKHDFAQEALVHTGIIGIEAAIRMYVEKYSRPTKIKDIVDVFKRTIDSADTFTKLEQAMVTKGEQKDRLLKQIDYIEKRINEAKSGLDLRTKINNLDLEQGMREKIKTILEQVLKVRFDKIAEVRGKQLELSEAKYYSAQYERMAKNLDSTIQVSIEKIVKERVINVANDLMAEYEKRIKELSKELEIVDGVSIEPLKLVSSKLTRFKEAEDIFNSFMKVKKVEDGTVMVDNPERKGFFGFFKFWKPSKIEETVYKHVRYIDGAKFATEWFDPFLAHLNIYENKAVNYLKQQNIFIQEEFTLRFKELDQILKDKLNELRRYTNNKNITEKEIAEIERKIKWLESIMRRLDDLLEI
ncbi:dynamin family protein [Megamonas hypermegale]|uniref:dynamin family protein n=1 Tax=Megamonas hypermegale TaxID=158847 RepID=UPI0026EDD680|nr:dynamin family protein [Megamonas hypermegale]